VHSLRTYVYISQMPPFSFRSNLTASGNSPKSGLLESYRDTSAVGPPNSAGTLVSWFWKQLRSVVHGHTLDHLSAQRRTRFVGYAG